MNGWRVCGVALHNAHGCFSEVMVVEAWGWIRAGGLVGRWAVELCVKSVFRTVVGCSQGRGFVVLYVALAKSELL